MALWEGRFKKELDSKTINKNIMSPENFVNNFDVLTDGIIEDYVTGYIDLENGNENINYSIDSSWSYSDFSNYSEN